jgi:FAD:protein FMN transferase
MKAGIKNKLIYVLLVLVFSTTSCETDDFITVSGKTMGTYYSIQYKSNKNFQPEIDGVLQSFIAAASTYDSTSEISQFNKTGSLEFRSEHLYRMLKVAKRIHNETSGAFEPTLMPLISAHGFGKDKTVTASTAIIDSLLAFVSFDYITFDSIQMHATKKGVQIDLSAMGEGFAIELIADFLDENKVGDYKIEIGGEMKCNGKNPSGQLWLIGIENPSMTGTQLMKTVRLDNESVSTSGSYRKFYTDKSGKRQSHIIDPRTGYPVQNNLLSVTIKATNAVNADAFATSCMVMGFADAVQFVDRSNVEAFIVYEEGDKVLSWHTNEFF